jgi:hypothetical protein
VRLALERLALRHGTAASARDIEKDRHKKETQKIADSGLLGDLFADQYVGLEPAVLASKLPRETYWVESLRREVPREELVSQLAAVAELRRTTYAKYQAIEATANVYRHELAIFDELLRARE